MNFNRLVKRYHVEVRELAVPSDEEVQERKVERIVARLAAEGQALPLEDFAEFAPIARRIADHEHRDRIVALLLRKLLPGPRRRPRTRRRSRPPRAPRGGRRPRAASGPSRRSPRTVAAETRPGRWTEPSASLGCGTGATGTGSRLASLPLAIAAWTVWMVFSIRLRSSSSCSILGRPRARTSA